MIAWVIEEEFGVRYHPGHVRKLLHGLAFRCSDRAACWPAPTPARRTAGTGAPIPTLKKSPRAKPGADLYRRSQLPTGLNFACHVEPRRPATRNPSHRTAQECQDPGRHRTVAHTFSLPPGHGLQRHDLLGIPGTVSAALSPARGDSDPDNASYHKDAEVWAWFRSNRHWLEVHQLPPYSPELNPTERLWQHTRRTGTHNRYFASEADLLATLTRVFGEMQSHPVLIRSNLLPFC